MAETSSPVSVDAISKALSVLLDDFRRGNQDSRQNVEETMKYMPEAYNNIGKKALELESVLSAFQHYVRHAIADARRRQNTLVPIHRLPSELLGYIFLFTAPEEYGPCGDVSVIHEENISDPPEAEDLRPDEVCSMAMNIASVSSYWRHTAISTSQLWSYVGTRNSLQVVKILLKRSKNTPLHVSCSASASREHERKFLTLVIPQLHRWKAFDAFTRSAAMSHAFNRIDRAAPLLEHYTIHNGAKTWKSDKLPTLILERAPLLRDLHIFSLSYPLGSNAVSGLTNLSVKAAVGSRAFTMEDFELLFSASPRLENLCIRGTVISDDDISVHLFSAKLSNLERLQISFLDPRVIIPLLHSLFPEDGLYPVTKIIGEWPVQGEMTTVLEPTPRGSLLDLYMHSMTWLTVTDCIEGRDEGTRIQVGMGIPNGVPNVDRLSLLEIDTYHGADDTEEMVAGLMCTDGTSLLRWIELHIHPHFEGTSLGSKLRLCPHLEHLILDVECDNDLQPYLPMIVALALPHLDDSEPVPSPGPRLKVLHIKWLDDLRPVVELFQTEYGPSQDVPITAGLLRGLEVLMVQYCRLPQEGTDAQTEQDLELLLDSPNIQLDIIRYNPNGMINM